MTSQILAELSWQDDPAGALASADGNAAKGVDMGKVQDSTDGAKEDAQKGDNV